MWVSTFHSACVRILRAEHDHAGLKSTFSIYDADDSRRLMQLVARELDLDPKRHPARGLAAQVSNLKNELVDPETFADRAKGPMERAVAEAYTLYQRRLKEAHALDFDDLIMTTVHLFQSHPHVAETYRRRFRHVLVDEYQDTNHAQYQLIKELVSGTEGLEPAELCVVGDADQSIYAFRGATIRNILEFERDYTDARTILLEQNYRSTQTILNAANAVISRNPSRKPKRLWSDQGAGESIVGYVADTEHAEADWVAREIDRLTDDADARPGDVAVFYRTNAQSRVFEEVFIRVGLPYKVVGGVRFYERREVRDALAYLRAIVNDDDTVSIRRVMNTPRRGIGDRAEGAVEALSPPRPHLVRRRDAPGRPTHPASPTGRSTASATSSRCSRACASCPTTAPPEEVLEATLTRSGYLAELEESTDPQDAGRVENLQELVSVAREFTERVEGNDERGHPGRLPGAGRAGRRRRPGPVRRPRPPGRGHPDDAAHGQGPRVPDRLPHRPRRRRLPAHARARRQQRARGRAPPGLRRHHPGPAAALPVARGHPVGVGRAVLQPDLALHRRAARRAGPLGAHRGGLHLLVRHGRRRRRPRFARRQRRRRARWRLLRRHPEGGRPGAAARHRRQQALDRQRAAAGPTKVAVGDRVNHQRYGLGRVLAVEGQGPSAAPRSTSATRPCGWSCATPRSKSSSRRRAKSVAARSARSTVVFRVSA